LEEHAHLVSSASDGKEALAAMREDKPDVVLLDIMMSSILDGLGVSEAMHDDPELSDIPVIVVSSITDSSYADQFPTDEHLHADNWISKPVQPDDLLKKIRLCLKNKQR
jgi:CheY-like chemotaxis protein